MPRQVVTEFGHGLDVAQTGAKRPSGMALKLLAAAEKHGLEVLA